MTGGLGARLVAELLLLGTLTGFLAGLLGIGGGMLLVPFLTLLLESKGMPAHLILKMAVATSLATIMFTSLSSVRAHHVRGAVRWEIVKLLAPGIVIGSMLGAQIAKALPARALALLFALFVASSATQMLRAAKARATAPEQLPGAGAMLSAGGVIGVLAALVGAGGGFVSVPFMSWRHVKIHHAVATSAALGFPIAFAGTVGYVIAGWSLHDLPPGTLGFIYVPALVAVSAASVFTAPLGAHAAHRLEVTQLKRAFALLLYLLAAYMLVRAAQG